MKDYIVEFLDDGARVIKDPEEIERKKNLPNVLIRPELPKKVSPSFWKLLPDGTIGVMEDEEKAAILNNSVNFTKKQKQIKKFDKTIIFKILFQVSIYMAIFVLGVYIGKGYGF